MSERIALGSADHRQKFGLPQPVDAAREAWHLLQGKTVAAVRFRPGPSDLAIDFSDQLHLETFHNSTGYEAWTFVAGRTTIVVQGGGDLAIWT